jgi:flagellar biosynthesis GTPase FlhF
MLIDLRNTPYHKYFSIKDSIFGSDRKDLTEEERKAVADQNMATALSVLPIGLGAYFFHKGKELKELRERRVKKGVRPENIPPSDGGGFRLGGWTFTLGGAGIGIGSQVVKNRLYDRKDKEEAERVREQKAREFLRDLEYSRRKEKTFAAVPNPAQQAQQQQRQQQAAQNAQRQQQMEQGRNNRATGVQNRLNQTIQNQTANRNTRTQLNNQNNQMKVQSNLIRIKEMQSKVAASSHRNNVKGQGVDKVVSMPMSRRIPHFR